MDNHTNRKLNIPEYLLLFLGFMNVTGRGTYLLLAFTGLYILLRTRTIRFKLNAGTAIYLAFFATFLAASLLFSGIRDAMMPVCGLLIFLVGQSIARQTSEPEEIKRTVFVSIAGLTVHGIMNFVINVTQMEKLALREVDDVWSGVQQATGHLSVFVPLIAGSFVILFLSKSHWANRVCGFLALLIGLVYTFLCATRYIFYLFLIVLVLEAILYFIMEKDPSSRRKMIGKISALVLLLTAIFAFNLFGARTAFLSSNLVTRVENFEVDTAVSSADRSEQIRAVLGNFEVYLWGGKPTGIPFVHNSWISNLNFGGIFLLLSFTVLMVRFVYILFRCKDRVDPVSFAYLLGYVTCMLAYCWIESLLESARILFYSMSMMLGVMEGIAVRSPIEKPKRLDEPETPGEREPSI